MLYIPSAFPGKPHKLNKLLHSQKYFQRMQAKPFHIIPGGFHSPVKLPQLHQSSLLPMKLPRAISISNPADNHVSGPLTVPDKDDSVAAFWDYQFLFVSQRLETAEPITLHVVDGAIPPDFPSGTYYLAGPGLFNDDHGSTVHPLDGHGYLRAFSIDGVAREVKFMARYVKTEAQVEEHDPVTDSWRFTHRGPFSVLKGGKKLGNVKVMKNVSNTSVLRWGGRLLCLWEGGDPYEIESGTLDTIGSFNVINDHDRLPEAEKKGTADLLDVAAQLLKPVLHGKFLQFASLFTRFGLYRQLREPMSASKMTFFISIRILLFTLLNIPN